MVIFSFVLMGGSKMANKYEIVVHTNIDLNDSFIYYNSISEINGFIDEGFIPLEHIKELRICNKNQLMMVLHSSMRFIVDFHNKHDTKVFLDRIISDRKVLRYKHKRFWHHWACFPKSGLRETIDFSIPSWKSSFIDTIKAKRKKKKFQNKKKFHKLVVKLTKSMYLH